MILLIGEFSSVHYELKRGMYELGIDSLTVSDGDSYKRIDADIIVEKSCNSRYAFVLHWLGLSGISKFISVKKKLKRYGRFEVVQIINPVAIEALGAIGNILLIRYLKKNSEIISLCALGDDFYWVRACVFKKYKYSPLDRWLKSPVKLFRKYQYSLRYIFSPLYVFLNFYAVRSAAYIVPGLEDYKIAYGNHPKLCNVIPLPIGKDKFKAPRKTHYPVRIFHGWQPGKDIRKGNDILDSAAKECVDILGEDKVRYEVVSGVAYSEYVKKYGDSDLFLDQIYSYDRGVNGALGMAAGKVVFSGFEYDRCPDNMVIGVNATADKSLMVEKMCELVNDIDEVDKIKSAAYEYASVHHSSETVARKYLELWGIG
ncbi:hypothetical protein [Halomonas sp. SCS19]|uniref:glycosyltransferase n=1 Tax=Halomonas sp. SCS19 TaxID=2950870 RepID=UPI0032DFE548